MEGEQKPNKLYFYVLRNIQRQKLVYKPQTQNTSNFVTKDEIKINPNRSAVIQITCCNMRTHIKYVSAQMFKNKRNSEN